MRVPMQAKACEKIANIAIQYVREYTYSRSWNSADKLSPTFKPGEVGIKSDVKYLLYQEKGTKPFLMLSLEGRVIPMKNNSGGTYPVKVVGVGQPGWVEIPANAKAAGPGEWKSNAAKPGTRIYRQQRWKHPGINPTNFMRNSLTKAIGDSKSIIKEALKDILGE